MGKMKVPTNVWLEIRRKKTLAKYKRIWEENRKIVLN
jgi:hypothetical protein